MQSFKGPTLPTLPDAPIGPAVAVHVELSPRPPLASSADFIKALTTQVQRYSTGVEEHSQARGV